MRLQDQLDSFTSEFIRRIPAAAIEVCGRSTRNLVDSRQADLALKVGDTLPDFTMDDTNGRPVSSKELLAVTPLVLTFYRGAWSPFCNIELKALEAVIDGITSRGALLIAISLQNPIQNRRSQSVNGLSFPILTDAGGLLSERMGLRWSLHDELIEVKKALGIDLPAIHSDGKWTLPMPARYVIDTDGTVAYAEVNPDYTRRPDPNDLFPVLDRLSEAVAA